MLLDKKISKTPVFPADMITQGGIFYCDSDYSDVTLPVKFKKYYLEAIAYDVFWATSTFFKGDYMFILNLQESNTSRLRFLNNSTKDAGAARYLALGI